MPTKPSIESQSLGPALFYSGDYDAALREADSAIENAHTSDERVAAYVAKATTHFERFRYLDALSVLREAGDLLDEVSPRLKAKFYGQRAALHSKTGNIDKALVDYEAGRHYAIQSGSKLCEACIRNNLSRIYSLAGRLDEALVEVDFAIGTATLLDQQFWLGRFIDQKAQILLDHDHFAEALSLSQKAVKILQLHGNETVLAEAKITHGKAWISVGASSLDRAAAFRIRRQAVADLYPELDREIVQEALEASNGNFTHAADMLGVSRVAMIKSVEKFGLTRQPKNRRGKSFSTTQK